MVSTSLVFNVNTPPAASISFTPGAPFSGSGTTFTASAPVAAGAICGVLSVTPSTWVGMLSLSGAQAASFQLQGTNLVVPSGLAVGVYDVTVTATP